MYHVPQCVFWMRLTFIHLVNRPKVEIYIFDVGFVYCEAINASVKTDVLDYFVILINEKDPWTLHHKEIEHWCQIRGGLDLVTVMGAAIKSTFCKKQCRTRKMFLYAKNI